MLLASLLLPLAVIAIVLLVQRLHLPVFLAIMATVVVYGIAADMTFMSVGKAFGLGFTAAIEQTGLLVVAGSMVSALVLRQPLGTGTAAAAAALAGLGASATGGLALLQPAGQDAPRRALGLALTLLAFAALAIPSPLAVAAASVMKIPPRSLAVVGLPLAVIAALLGWWHVSRQVPANKIAGHVGWPWLGAVTARSRRGRRAEPRVRRDRHGRASGRTRAPSALRHPDAVPGRGHRQDHAGQLAHRHPHRLGHGRADAARPRPRQRHGPRPGCRRDRRGLDGDLPRQRSVLLDRRQHGAAVAGPRALRDLAGQRGDGSRRADRAGGAAAVSIAAARASAATASPRAAAAPWCIAAAACRAASARSACRDGSARR